MIIPTALLLVGIGYLFYTSKREVSLNNQDTEENQIENDLYKDLEDLFI